MKKKRYFQWIAGDSAGSVTTLDNITCFDGEYFYNFTDGDSCNMRFVSPMTKIPKMLEGKVVVEIANPYDPWKIEKVETKKYVDPRSNEQYEIPPLADYVKAEGENCEISDSVIGKMNYIPPRYKGQMRALPNIDDYLIDEDEEIESAKVIATANSKPVQEIEVEEVAVTQVAPTVVSTPVVEANTAVNIDTIEEKSESSSVKNDPVYLIIKNCKKRPTDIELSISIDLPSKSVFEMVKEDFEAGSSKFIDCVIEDIDTKIILDSLKDALLEAYCVENTQ